MPVFDIRCENYYATVPQNGRSAEPENTFCTMKLLPCLYPLPLSPINDRKPLLPDSVHIVDLAPDKWLKSQWVLHGIYVRLHARMMTRTVQFGREDERGATKPYQLSGVRGLHKCETDA